MTTFDSSKDGFIQIEQLESIIKDHGINQKKKKTQLDGKRQNTS